MSDDTPGTIPGFDFFQQKRPDQGPSQLVNISTNGEDDEDYKDLYDNPNNPLEEYLRSPSDDDEIDLDKYPPEYAKFLRYGATELVAEKLYELITEKYFIEGEINEQTARNLCRRSQRDECGIVGIIEAFRSTVFEETDDRQHSLKFMFKKYTKGHNYLKPYEIIAPMAQAQKRLDEFYSSPAAEGYKVLVTSGVRRFCYETAEADEIMNKHQVFIGRIPKDCYEDELVTCFGKIGKIESVCLLMDASSNKNRGFAFLNYDDESLADVAVSELDQSFIRPYARIGVTRGSASQRLFIGGLPRDKTKEEFLVAFRELFEGVEDLDLKQDMIDKKLNRGFVFIDFTDRKSATIAKQLATTGTCSVFDKVLTNAHWAKVMKRPIEEHEINTEHIKKLFVKGLDVNTKQEHIYLTFIPYGEVELIRRQGDYAFIHFVNRKDAQKVLDNPPNEIDGITDFKIMWATPKRKQYNNWDNDRPSFKGPVERFIPPGYNDRDWIPPEEYQTRKREGTLPNRFYDRSSSHKHKNGRHDSGKKKRRSRSPIKDPGNEYGWAWGTGRSGQVITSFSTSAKGNANFDTTVDEKVRQKQKMDILSFFDIKEIPKTKKKESKSERSDKPKNDEHRGSSSSRKRRHRSRSSENRKECQFKLPDAPHESQRQKYHIMQQIAKRRTRTASGGRNPPTMPPLYPNESISRVRGDWSPDNSPQYPGPAFNNVNNVQQSFHYNPNNRQTLQNQEILPPVCNNYPPEYNSADCRDFNDYEFEDYDEQNRPVCRQPFQGQSFQGQPFQRQPFQDQSFQGQPFQGQSFQGPGRNYRQPPNHYYHEAPKQRHYDQHPQYQHHHAPHPQNQRHHERQLPNHHHYEQQLPNQQSDTQNIMPCYDPGNYVDPNRFYRLDGNVKSQISNL